MIAINPYTTLAADYFPLPFQDGRIAAKKQTEPTGAEIAAGDLVHTVMAIVGISAIIAASAVLFSIIKYLGAAYLVFLGIRAILEKSWT